MLRGDARDARDGRRGLTCLHVNRRDGDQSTSILCGSHAGIMTVQYEPMRSSLSYTGHDLSLQAVRSHNPYGLCEAVRSHNPLRLFQA